MQRLGLAGVQQFSQYKPYQLLPEGFYRPRFSIVLAESFSVTLRVKVERVDAGKRQ
jgi:hypothetical protein